jgi:hypothetical protein
MIEHKNIHEAINGVMEEVGYVKKSRSAGVSYSFAGEAALIAAIRPAMVEHGIYMHVAKIESITRENVTTKNGAQMVNTLISAVIRFTHSASGSSIDSASTGEGFDSGDKSANKAMTGLYKYAMRQTFCIETGDDPDKQHEERKPEMTLERAQAMTTADGKKYGDLTRADLDRIKDNKAAPEEKKQAARLLIAQLIKEGK